MRIAPATKLAQVFYNRRIHQRRSRSDRPEHAYNSDLVRYYLSLQHKNVETATQAPYLHIPESIRIQLYTAFTTRYAIPAGHKLIFIHPGSGGSAANLSPEQFAQLANAISCPLPYTIVVSCAPAEEEQARLLASLLTVPHVVYISNEGLQRFVEHISLADLFISGSTGPLHVAGALNRPTAGFYPNRRSATPLRWQTLSTDDRRLAFSPPLDAAAEDMSQVDIESAARIISQKLLKLYYDELQL